MSDPKYWHKTGISDYWSESKSGYSWFRKDSEGNVYIVTSKFAKGYSGYHAKDLRVKYANGAERYFTPQQITEFVGWRKTPSLINNGKSYWQGNVFYWVDDVILKKEGRSSKIE